MTAAGPAPGPATLAGLEAAGPDGRWPVRLGAPLAEGGDAAVYAVRGRADLVAKVYHDPAAEPRRRAKLEAMLAAPPEGRAAEHGGRTYVQLAWPDALLERAAPPGDGAPDGAGLPAGFLMPRVDLAHAVSLESWLSARARRAAGLPDAYRDRVAVAYNLAAAVAALHARGHHVVDLKPSNVHVYRGVLFVALLDCDGMSVAAPGGAGDGQPAGRGRAGRFPAHQYTDGYIAPEALRARAEPEDLGEAQDQFALAVVVFRLLCNGLHPFQGVPAPGADVPTTDGARVAAGLYPYGPRGGAGRLAPPPSSLYPFFGRTTQALFDRAFSEGRRQRRPSAAEWRGHLGLLLANGLRPCDRDADHVRFGDAPCGACGTAPQIDPAPSLAPWFDLPGTDAPAPVAPEVSSMEREAALAYAVLGFVLLSLVVLVIFLLNL